MSKEAVQSIRVGENTFGFSEIDQLMRHTSYGQKLSKNIRWRLFKPDFLKEQKWVEILGRDVDNLEHMKLMRGLTQQFVKAQNLKAEGSEYINQNDQKLLYLTSTIHDYQEAETGDIPNPLKTEDDVALEVTVLSRIGVQLFDTQQLSEELQAVCEIMSNTETNLGRIWRCIEDLGYLRAGMIAYQESLSLDKTARNLTVEQQAKLKANLQAMAFAVMQADLVTCMKYAEGYPGADYILGQLSGVITHAFDNLDEEQVAKHYTLIDGRDKLTDYRKSKDLWFNEYLSIRG